MAVRHLDGFEYASSDLTLLSNNDDFGDPWAKYNAWGILRYSIYGRTSGALSMEASGFTAWIRRTFAALPIWIVGFAYQPVSVFATKVCEVFSGGWNGTSQLYVRANAGGTLTICRGDGTELATSSASQIIYSTRYQYIEFKFTVSATAGTVQLRVDGVDWISLTGVNTDNAGSGAVDTIGLGISALTDRVRYDDFYIADTLGGANDDFLGAIKISYVRPNGPGQSSQWTPVGAGTIAEAIDDVLSDEDGTYATATTASDEYLCDLADFSASTNIVSLAVDMRGRLDTAGARAIRNVIRTGGTKYQSADLSFGLTYDDFQTVYDKNPNTGLFWTQAEINALQAGAIVSS